jgi:hypothetical protein
LHEEGINPASETLCFKQNRSMDNVQELNNSTIFGLVGMTMDYGLDGRGSVPGQQESYPMGAAGPLPWGEADQPPLTHTSSGRGA